MSLALPLPPVPVLSPIRQDAGRPALSRLSPVLFATNQPIRRSRDAADRTSPATSFCIVPSMASGEVVSRGSRGVPSFGSVSMRSRRVTVSPSPRAKAVKPAGPPKLASIRLAAVLSLRVTAAAQIAKRRHRIVGKGRQGKQRRGQ
jgi:hypothetical protein